MKKRYYVLMSLCIVAGLLLAGRSTADTKLSGDQAHAEQVVRDYFQYWNERNLAGLQTVTNLYQPNVDWELDKLESVSLVTSRRARFTPIQDNRFVRPSTSKPNPACL